MNSTTTRYKKTKTEKIEILQNQYSKIFNKGDVNNSCVDICEDIEKASYVLEIEEKRLTFKIHSAKRKKIQSSIADFTCKSTNRTPA